MRKQIRDHQQSSGPIETARRIRRIGGELVDRVEGLELDAGRFEERLVAEFRTHPLERLAGAGVAVGGTGATSSPCSSSRP